MEEIREKLITTREQEEELIKEEKEGKRPKILGKGGLEQISGKEFASDLVLGYELYLKESDLNLKAEDLKKIPRGKIEGAHFVTSVDWEDKPRQVDLSDEGEFGDKCEKDVEKTLDLIKETGGKYVVVHVGTFDPKEVIGKGLKSRREIVEADKKERDRRILEAAKRITRLNESAQQRGLTLVIENDPSWILVKYNRGILTNPESLSLLLENIPQSVKVIFDEEHLYRAAVFGTIWEDFLERYIKSEDERKISREILGELSQRINQKTTDQFKKDHIFPFVERMIDLASDRLFGLHVCGWDFRKDSSDLEIPVEGASVYDTQLLPRRVIKDIGGEGILLKDMIDHRHILEMISEKIGRGKFAQLKIILEYARHLRGRKYLFPSRGEEPKPQDQAKEFEIAVRSLRHLVSGVMKK